MTFQCFCWSFNHFYNFLAITMRRHFFPLPLFSPTPQWPDIANVCKAMERWEVGWGRGWSRDVAIYTSPWRPVAGSLGAAAAELEAARA